ncbi:MAG TPA: S8 family serine peptidase [Pyrinomonadaceae bacterium]|nr:S8 family serine peptidase [Pyrinomonadaceae bacterium]
MFKRLSATLIAVLFFCLATSASARAASVAPDLLTKLHTLAANTDAGLVIVAFDTTTGLDDTHLGVLRAAGITRGLTLQRLGMVAVPSITVGQIRTLSANPAVRSVWSNERLFYYMNQARVLAGVDRLRTDANFTHSNGGLPVSGAGNFSVVVNDSGIDATHNDLKFGTKVIQNVQTLSDSETLTGFTSLQTVEGLPNTDTHVGHGTHCAGILGGTGQQSANRYGGVAPGAKLIGTGSGIGLFVLNALGGFEWSLANQFQYNIRIISNSWGGGGDFDPNNPINIASKLAHDNNIVVVFAAGNSGPGPDTHNPYGKAPWVISVAAGTKEGGLASFSSRGIPREERLADSDPNNDNDAPTITAPGTGREFETNAAKFSAAVVSTRSITNIVSNGLDSDTEIPVAYLPFYTQISGTSMATPFAAGVAALMLDADPTLSPDQVKEIMQQTASRMPGREDFEVGAGYINAYAAVDKVFNRSKPYGQFVAPDFNTQVGIEYQPWVEDFTVDFTPAQPGRQSTNSHHFQVEEGIGVLNVSIDFGTNAVTDETGNALGLVLYPPGCEQVECGYSSGIALPALDSPSRQVVVRNPAPGDWTAEVRGLRGLVLNAAGVAAPSSPFGIAVPETVNGRIKKAIVTVEEPSDIANHPAASQIRAALESRMMDTFADNTFRPDAPVSRAALAEALMLNTPLRQTLSSTPKFGDVSGRLAAVAESATAKGSTLRDWDFTPAGMMSASTGVFNPNISAQRIDVAVALVRALGLDAEARALAGRPVTVNYNGQTITLADNADIPLDKRGYVQLALDRQLIDARFTLEQGPFDFQPKLKARAATSEAMTRAFLAHALANFRQHFVAGT